MQFEAVQSDYGFKMNFNLVTVNYIGTQAPGLSFWDVVLILQSQLQDRVIVMICTE
jgi:hypothetical protein